MSGVVGPQLVRGGRGSGGRGQGALFLDRVPPEATVVVVGPAAGPEDAAEQDVPQADFDAMLARASQHAGYSVCELPDRVEATLPCPAASADEDVVLLLQQQAVAAQVGGSAAASLPQHSVTWRRQLGTPELLRCGPDTALLVRALEETAAPPWAFPLDDGACDVLVKGLELRVHERARLRFEVEEREGAPPCRRRRVRLLLWPDLEASEAQEQELRRTVQNTIQVVLLGMPPIVARSVVAVGGKPPGPPLV